MTTMTCRRPRPAGGHPELHDARRLRAAARRTRAPDERGAALGGAGGVLGGVQWRPFRERRLSLRQETSARDRPPHALPDQAPGHRRSGRSRHPAQPRPGLFGATVLYSDKAGEDHTVTIVGVDEAEPLAGKISWISPVARALIKAGKATPQLRAGRHRGTGYPGSTVSAGLMRILASKRGCKSGIADHCKNVVTGAARTALPVRGAP